MWIVYLPNLKETLRNGGISGFFGGVSYTSPGRAFSPDDRSEEETPTIIDFSVPGFNPGYFRKKQVLRFAQDDSGVD